MAVRDVLKSAMQAPAIRALTTLERLQSGAVYNPIDPRNRRDPYPAYRRLRERDPIHRSRLISGWILTRYDDIVEVLRDPRFVVDSRKQPNYEKQRAEMVKAGVVREDRPDSDISVSMLRSDPPDHTRLRSLVTKAFTPRAVEALRPRIEAIIEEQLAAVEGKSGMDIVRELAYPLPVTVIAEMLGIPTADRARFKHWSDEIIRALGFSTMDDLRRSMRAQQELEAYLAVIAEERRREPREDLLSALLAAEEQGDKLSMAEVFDTTVLLLVAGNETTTNLIGNGMLALLRNPDQLDLLRRDPSLIENAVEELLRYDSPVQATSRFPAEETDYHGHTVKAGQELILVLGAGNRDPEQFADPDRLDITRGEIRHLSFSHGIHYCLGAPLARIEGAAAINALAQRFPDMRLATSEQAWGDNIILRGMTSLPVTF